MTSLDSIKELRDRTGVSIMQCRKALENAGGDMEQAMIALRKQSSEMAEKKSERTLRSGVVGIYAHNNRMLGSMVKLRCETDFVANNEEFRTLADDIAMHIAAMAPEYLSECEIPEEAKMTARDLFTKEAEGLNKPADILEKIIEGKLATYFKEKVLLNQPFVKNDQLTIADLVKDAVQKFGENTEIESFVRFSTK